MMLRLAQQLKLGPLLGWVCKSTTVQDAAGFCKAQTGNLDEDMIETITLAFLGF